MQASVSGTTSGNAITLPADCREVQSLRVTVGGYARELPPLPPQALEDAALPMDPKGYVTVNGSLQIVGVMGDLPYTLTYWQAIPSLATAGTNWLLTRHPDLYLYAALGQSAPFLKDDERLITWGTLYRTIKDSVEAEDAGARYGNAPRMVIPQGVP